MVVHKILRCARSRAETEGSGAEGVTAGKPKTSCCAELPMERGGAGGAGRRFSTSFKMLVVISVRRLATDSVTRVFTYLKDWLH